MENTRNTSDLRDDLFCKLSPSGQRLAIKTAKANRAKVRAEAKGSPLKAKPLSPAQKRAILKAHKSLLGVHTASDCRPEFVLCAAGFMTHVGGVLSNRPMASFTLTEKGIAVAKELSHEAAK